VTVLLVTHEADVAAYAERAVHFHDGVIRADRPNPAPRDARRELAERPPELAGV
jgi:ABC-type lipoprotein export system ATPase subunit